MKFTNLLLMSAVAGAGNPATLWFRMDKLEGGGVTEETTGTLSGSWAFQVTNDERPNAIAPTNPIPLTVPAGFSSGNPSGAALNFAFDFSVLPRFRWMRMVYTNSAGAGNITLKLHGRAAGD